MERVNDPPPAAGQALIARVSRAIERELTQIEAIVGGHYVAPHQRTEAERRARTLAPTLREVTTLRLSEKKEKREDGDAVPRDLGELRLAFARRLDQLVADTKAAHPDAAECNRTGDARHHLGDIRASASTSAARRGQRRAVVDMVAGRRTRRGPARNGSARRRSGLLHSPASRQRGSRWWGRPSTTCAR